MKLVKLTDLAGNPVWFNPANVIAIKVGAPGEAGAGAQSGIMVSSGGVIWVMEDPQKVATAFEAAA